MAEMEFLKQNTVNTTGLIVVQSNTGTAQYLFDRNLKLGYSTSGFTTNTSSVISIQFSTPTVLSNLLIQNHNLKQFRAFYNSVTANTFTPDVNVTTNSATSSYFSFNSITVNSIQLQLDTKQTADTEGSVGEFVVTERRLQFERNPSTDDFDPELERTKVVHKMPDGGVKVYFIKDKFQSSLEWAFVTQTFRNSLLNVFEEALPLYFVNFPTTTGWDGRAYEVVWMNNFNFKHGDNAKTQGFNGSVDLAETSNT